MPVFIKLFRLFFSCGIVLSAAALGAQTTTDPQAAIPPQVATPAPPGFLGIFTNSKQWHLEQISANHLRLTGQVELEQANQTKFFADEIEIFTDTSRVIASGNVVFTNGEGRISAERVEFNTESNTGTFYQASGILSLGAKADRAQFGNQDPDVYFYGDMLEKIGQRQYKVTRGGFTTCVQPTPRWEIASGSVTLNLNEYAIARNTVLRVKGVPLMYMPLVYYPIQQEDRATGFLLPTYGASTLRGQSISNAFFWALGRSHDATFFHDWFTHTGQGAGAEYRYVAGQQSSGNFRVYGFDQHEATFAQSGRTTILPAKKSYQFIGSANQALGAGLRARARIDYVSDLVNQQLYQQSIYRASNATRVIEGGVSGAWRGFTSSALYQRTEYFSGSSDSNVYGSTPRLSAAVAPQRFFGLPIYGALNTEYAFLPYLSISKGVTTSDRSLGRFDLLPTVRIPLSQLTFLSVNTSASYRTTYYTRSLDAKGKLLPEPLLRQYASVRSEIIGPVFTRIWDRPESTFAARLKHVIEPTFAVDYITDFKNESGVPELSDPSDSVVGGAARFTYGLHNRLFSRARTEDGSQGHTREFVTVGLQQTYYSNSQSSRSDTSYVSASSRPKPVDLSPVALTIRVAPTSALDANARLEYDVSGNGLQIFTTGATAGGRPLSTNVSYSRYRYTSTSPANSYLTTSTSTKIMQGQFGGTYSLSWDLGRSYVVSQSVMASYLAQCCGLQLEFQNYNYPQGTGIPVLADRRFNFSFVLAGLGTFSNFFGAFGGLAGSGR